MPDISIYMAFGAGLISFLSPCILPLVPGYISFISGVSFEQLKQSPADRSHPAAMKGRVLLNSLFFVAGFSLVFILLGASATWLGAFLAAETTLLSKIAGAVIIFFGIYKMGLIPTRFFYREARFQIGNKKYGYAGAALIGAAFAFGWTPCIGPVLAGILAFAGTLEKVSQGVMLLFIYSLGLGIPFLLTALAINRFWGFFGRIKKYLRLLEVTGGAIMVALGLLIYTNRLILIPGYLTFLSKFAM